MATPTENTKNYSAASSSPIVPSNTNVIGPFRGLYVGGTGDVAVRMIDTSLPLFKSVPIGTILPIQFDQVLATGTTATLMVGLA